MAKDSDKIARPPTPVVKPNHPIPAGTHVERQETGRINSPNPAGGYVPPNRYAK